jgi:hypothetical protein
MSIYQGAPQGGGGLGQNQIQLPGTAPDLSLLDPTDIMGGPLDLDMSLPMDLDMDFSGTNTARHKLATAGRRSHGSSDQCEQRIQ